MANPRIQPTRALAVIPSDNADVPFVGTNISGLSGGPVANYLVDATKNFQTLQVFPGDIVYNLSAGLAATVAGAAVAGATDRVLLNADIFLAAGDDYIIYQSSPFNGGQNTGAVLYVGTGGDVEVTTAGGDIVTFFNVQNGSFMPVQIIKVWGSTSASGIIALW
jgi:hypothetical protein